MSIQNPYQVAGFGQMQQPYYGGYPYGYPPNMSYGQTQQPQQSQINMPLEITYRNGSTAIVPASNNMYVQGGTMMNQGGYNPMTGITSQTCVGQGYSSPYNQMIGNPSYGISYPPMQKEEGIYPYCPEMDRNRQYMSPQPNIYSAFNVAGQSEFDSYVQNLLYEAEPSCVSTRDFLENIILSDEEREKLQKKRDQLRVVSYDYYGNPIYNNNSTAYNYNQKMQEDFEMARHSVQCVFTYLSRVAHQYNGEIIDEESAMEFYDPIKPVEQPQQFNFFTATEEEKRELRRQQMYHNVFETERRIQRYSVYLQYFNMQKQKAYDKIKESHDRLIGVEPGEHYDLKTYMDNGYKIMIDANMKKMKSQNRNGTRKYSRNDYRASLSSINQVPVPITSKDDEYITVEETMKRMYDKNKQASIDCIVQDPNTGKVSYTSEPAFSSEYEAHLYFMKALQEKKDKDDMRRSCS